jgi:hypothetical protein
LEAVSLPAPEPGLVIRYSCLWHREHRAGLKEGQKDRPCAIVLALKAEGGKIRVAVVPVTQSPAAAAADAIEIPPEVKRHLGLDMDRSWAVTTECNSFLWPGPDLRRIGDRDDGSIAYGFLPPKLFAEIQKRFRNTELTARAKRVARTE